MTGPVLFVAASLALAILAARLVGHHLPAADLASRALATVVSFVGLACAVLLATGLTRHLTPVAAALASGLLLAFEVVTSGVRPARGDRPRRAVAQAVSATVGERAALILLGGLLAWWAGRTIGAGTGYSFDDLTYHAAIPAWWARQGAIELVPLTYQAYYPLNAELFASWFVLPFPTDALANASVFVWMALVVLACATLARELGLSPIPVALAVSCFVLAPGVGSFAATYCANDLAVAGLGMAMLALAAPSAAHGARGTPFFSGLAGGLALGTKATIAPQVLLVAVWLASAGGGWQERGRRVAAFAVAAIVSGSAWYVRNLVLTGNPLYPAELGPFSGPFSTAAQRKTSLIPTLQDGWMQGSVWVDLLGRRFDWPIVLGLLSLTGYVIGALAAWRTGPGPRRRLLVLVVLAGISFLALFPLSPFSGTNDSPQSPLHSLSRYLAWPFLIGLVLAVTLAQRHRGAMLASSIVAGLALVAARPDLDGKVAWLAGGIGGGAILQWAMSRLQGRGRPLVGGGLAALALTALALRADAAERASAAHMYGFGKGRPVGDAWRRLEQIPDGSRVAALTNQSAGHVLYRPLFGRRLQHHPVAVDQAGRALPPLHLQAPRSDWWREAPIGELSGVVASLRAARIDFVVLTRWPLWPHPRHDPPWPAARAALTEPGQARRRYATNYVELWDLRPTG